MAEYIERFELLKKIDDELYLQQSTRSYLKMLVRKQPAADVVEVVRCKDCIHKVVTEDGEYNPDDIVCDYHMSDGFCENDFCSYGKKMDGKEGKI